MGPLLTTPSIELSEDERRTVEYYNTTTWKRPAGYWDPWILAFTRHLVAGSSVLEIGCGEAYPADLLRESGFDYVGIDISERFIELAVERDPTLNVSTAFADNLAHEDSSLGGWLALNVLQHIEREHLPAILREAHRVLAPGGAAFCTVAHHPEDSENCDRRMWEKKSLGMPSTRLFVFWQRAEIEELFREAGFSVVDYGTCVTNTAGVEGDSVFWHEFTLRADK